MRRPPKEKYLRVRLHESELLILKERADEHGFSGISEYVRFHLFFPGSFISKIEEIYREVCKNEK